ncbi:MAG: hypothetical protein H0T51_22110 [Pirellulales bacterium]|nr:hypothetical protein [Pirellulales bacterium]
MNSVWQSLLWKEWREHRLILAILAALFIVIPPIFSLRTPTNFFSILSFTLFAVPMVSMFIAMNIAAGEQSAGTIRFLQSLPITGRKPAAAKLFWAVATVIVPILLAVGAAVLWSWMLEEAAQEAIAYDEGVYQTAPGSWFAARCFTPSVAAISLILWMAAAGVNRSDEVRAGAIGILVVASYWLLIALGGYTLDVLGLREPYRLFPLLFSTAPGGVGILSDRMSFASDDSSMLAKYWPLAVVGVLSHGALAAWYVGRFGRVVPGKPQAVERPAAPRDRHWLAPPLRSPLFAIAWKQLRESGPLAVLGATCIAAIAIFIYVAHFSLDRAEVSDLTPVDMFEGMAAAWIIVGLMVATVAGVGVFMDDLKPGLYAFWRSRPINVDQWFAVKFIAGLLVTVVTLAIPLLLVTAYLLIVPDAYAIHHKVSINDAIRFVGVGLLAQSGLYSAAVAAIVLLRRPIHAAFASLAAAWVAGMAAVAAAAFADRRIGQPNHGLLAIFLVAIFTLAVIFLAWLAVRKNWGWKH